MSEPIQPTSNLVTVETLAAWIKGSEEYIESGVATDLIAVCPVALAHACRELLALRREILEAKRHRNDEQRLRLAAERRSFETSGELERLRKLQENALALDDAVAEFGIDKPEYLAEVYQAFHDALHDGHGCPSVVETAAPETTAPRCDWHDRELECAVCCGYVDGLDRGTCGPNAKVYVGSSQETKPKPTIEGLERLLQAEDSKQVYVWPDGYVHDTPPPEKAPEAHIDYNVPGCDCLGCELAPKASTDEVLREGKCANCGKSWVVKGDPAAVVSVLAVHCTCGHINK